MTVLNWWEIDETLSFLLVNRMQAHHPEPNDKGYKNWLDRNLLPPFGCCCVLVMFRMKFIFPNPTLVLSSQSCTSSDQCNTYVHSIWVRYRMTSFITKLTTPVQSGGQQQRSSIALLLNQLQRTIAPLFLSCPVNIFVKPDPEPILKIPLWGPLLHYPNIF